MKYRMLSSEELEVFDEDFKHFLVVNGVHNDEWIELNEKSPEKAVELVEMFSDSVLQKVYEKLKFIEHRSVNACLVFKLGPEQIDLISISCNPKSDIDLSTPESIHQAIIETPSELSFFRTNKVYSKNRELEIHEMMNQGCVNSSEAFWMLLEKALD